MFSLLWIFLFIRIFVFLDLDCLDSHESLFFFFLLRFISLLKVLLDSLPPSKGHLPPYSDDWQMPWGKMQMMCVPANLSYSLHSWNFRSHFPQKFSHVFLKIILNFICFFFFFLFVLSGRLVLQKLLHHREEFSFLYVICLSRHFFHFI